MTFGGIGCGKKVYNIVVSEARGGRGPDHLRHHASARHLRRLRAVLQVG